MSKQEQKVKDGVAPFLEEGEEALAAIIARPRGWTQTHAGSIHLGANQQGKSRSAADEAGFPLASPMALVVTQRRLLSFSIGSPIGLGKGGDVKELVGAVGLEEVDSIDVNAAADVKGLIAAFEGSRTTA